MSKPMYPPIREWRCDWSHCDSHTTDWHGDGWFITGLSNRVPTGPNSDTDREPAWEALAWLQRLQSAGALRRLPYSYALICNKHYDEFLIDRSVNESR